MGWGRAKLTADCIAFNYGPYKRAGDITSFYCHGIKLSSLWRMTLRQSDLLGVNVYVRGSCESHETKFGRSLRDWLTAANGIGNCQRFFTEPLTINSFGLFARSNDIDPDPYKYNIMWSYFGDGTLHNQPVSTLTTPLTIDSGGQANLVARELYCSMQGRKSLQLPGCHLE